MFEASSRLFPVSGSWGAGFPGFVLSEKELIDELKGVCKKGDIENLERFFMHNSVSIREILKNNVDLRLEILFTAAEKWFAKEEPSSYGAREIKDPEESKAFIFLLHQIDEEGDLLFNLNETSFYYPKTLFFVACEKKRASIVDTLLEFELDPFAQCHGFEGNTPFQVICQNGDFEMMNVLFRGVEISEMQQLQSLLQKGEGRFETLAVTSGSQELIAFLTGVVNFVEKKKASRLPSLSSVTEDD